MHIHVATLNRALNRFGTDLPSTRAPRPRLDSDYLLVVETLGEEKSSPCFLQECDRVLPAEDSWVDTDRNLKSQDLVLLSAR